MGSHGDHRGVLLAYQDQKIGFRASILVNIANKQHW